MPVVIVLTLSVALLYVALQMYGCMAEHEGFWAPFFCTLESLLDAWNALWRTVTPP